MRLSLVLGFLELQQLERFSLMGMWWKSLKNGVGGRMATQRFAGASFDRRTVLHFASPSSRN